MNNNFSYTSFLKKKITKPKNLKELIKLLKKKHTLSGSKDHMVTLLLAII